MAFFNVGHGRDWTHNPKGFEWPLFHLRGHQLLYQVGKSSVVCQCAKSVMARFIKREIICRYGLPERIESDNGLNLNNDMVAEVRTQFKIKHHNSVPYRPKMNGAVETVNKNVKKIIAKATETYKDWHEKLPFALHAYRTGVWTSTGATPYSLVYGMETVLPIEVEIPSLQVLREVELEEAE